MYQPKTNQKQTFVNVANLNINLKSGRFLFFLFFFFFSFFFWTQKTGESGRLVSKNEIKSMRKIKNKCLIVSFPILFTTISGTTFVVVSIHDRASNFLVKLIVKYTKKCIQTNLLINLESFLFYTIEYNFSFNNCWKLRYEKVREICWQIGRWEIRPISRSLPLKSGAS